MATDEFPNAKVGGWILFFMGQAAPDRPWIATRRIVKLMEDVGYEVSATRVALARLFTEGSLERRRSGRESSYRLCDTAAENELYHRRRTEAFGAEAEWDGNWTLLLASLSDDLRPLRYHVRTRLSVNGFGRLRENVWFAARDREDEVKAIVEDLGITDHVFVFVGRPSSIVDVDDVLRTSWDFEALTESYRAFASRFAHLRSPDQRRRLSDDDLLLWWLRITHDYRSMTHRDPDLPHELMPPDARRLRSRAVETYAAVEGSLAPRARRVAFDRLGLAPDNPNTE